MPAVCKHCGEHRSILSLVYHRVLYGELPMCEECGADEVTLEVTDGKFNADYEEKVTYVCIECGLECTNVPGLGPYCQNNCCPVETDTDKMKVK